MATAPNQNEVQNALNLANSISSNNSSASPAGLARVNAINQSFTNSPTGSQGYIATSPGAQNTDPLDQPGGVGIPDAQGNSATPPSSANATFQKANPTQAINTAQPSPKPQDIQSPDQTQDVPYSQAQQNLNSGGLKGQDLANAQQSLKQHYQQGLQNVTATGAPAPQSPAAGNLVVNAATPQDNTSPAVNNFLNPENPAVQDSTKQLLDFLNPQAERDALQQHIDQLATDRSALAGLKTDLMNTKNVMAGTEQDIRDEITKAGGFGSNSQVMALTIARNKTLVQQAQQLTDQIQSQTDLVNSDVSLVGDEKQLATQQFTQRMSLLNYQQQNQQNAFNALKDSYTKMMDINPTGLRSALLADPAQAQRFQQVTGLSPDSLQGMASTQALDAQAKQASIANIYSEIQKRNFDMSQGIPPTSPTSPGNTSQVSPALTPYLNTSASGVDYIDASTLQGTAKDKTNIINQATAAGLKVITNKNTAADLVNIKDAYSKLDTIQTTMAGIGQPGWISRLAGGLGLTKLETATQSDPQKAAAGVLQSVGLDILKAISGVQGFRGNQTAIQQVTDHLPKITDTVDTINSKVGFIKALISDREDAAVGAPKQTTPQVVPASQIPTGYYQASDGLIYKK